ncbi:UNVERIFIED_CONTAM: hypothetical protein Sradi_5695300 [Sesamum radiatum]|uniref:Uncharacterized protein n=1 Tax=Sesamum radiatum TaxID=300843 RepID=A0AAW2L139_SESRA
MEINLRISKDLHTNNHLHLLKPTPIPYAPRGYRENTRLEHSTIPTRNSCKHPKFGVSNEPISLFRQSSRIPRCLCLDLPFGAFAKSKKEEDDKEILETLSKVEVNIPLLDAIKQVPRYAKFLKEMCTNKSKLREKAMCDLGASINVMPLSIYESLNIGPLKETCVVLQLADRSIVYPEGVLEDVLVQVNELVFPADFYVINMMDNSPNSTSILLGRPFLKTSKTKIDVDAGILSMEFDNEVVSFSIGDTMQNSHDVHSIFLIDFIDTLVQGNAMFDGGGAFKMTINKSLTSSPRTYKK